MALAVDKLPLLPCSFFLWSGSVRPVWFLGSLQSLCSRPQLNTIRHLTPVRSIRPTGQARRAAKLSIHFCDICGLFTLLNVYPVKSTGLKWTISLGLALLNQEFILSGRSLFNWGMPDVSRNIVSFRSCHGFPFIILFLTAKTTI